MDAWGSAAQRNATQRNATQRNEMNMVIPAVVVVVVVVGEWNGRTGRTGCAVSQLGCQY